MHSKAQLKVCNLRTHTDFQLLIWASRGRAVFPAVLTHICCADNSFTQLLDTMAAMSASSVTFKTAVAPRVVRSRATKLTRATRGSVATQAAVTKIPVSEVKDHLDRGFVLVDIRDPEECAETGYKSSWKNIVVRTRTFPRFASRGPHPRARTRGNAKTWRLQGRPFLPSGKPTARFLNLSGYRSARPVRRRARDETCVAPMKRFLLTGRLFFSSSPRSSPPWTRTARST